jgi:hypothetical protein
LGSKAMTASRLTAPSSMAASRGRHR